MTVDFNLPHLGENINTADIIKVLVKEGEKVSVDQTVIEIETDKATVEVPSEIAGVIQKVYVKEGQKAKVGEPIISVEVNGTGVENKEQKVESKEQKEVANEKVEEKQKPQPDKPANNKDQITTNNQQLTTNVYEFQIPVLGENISSAQITKVLIKPGDKVENDQSVLEIETDKATVEIPTEVSGIVKEVKVKEGDKVAVGSLAFTLETKAILPDNKTKVQSKKIESTEEQNKTGKQLPSLDSQLTVPKEHTHMPQLVELPRDLSKVVVPAAPSVRRFAREIGIDIHQVRGTEPNGRISIEDVKAYSKALNEQFQRGGVSTAGFGITHEPLPDFSKWGEIDRQPMSNIRRKTAEHLSYAWATIPHVTQYDKADITDLENLRKQFGKKVEVAGGKLTVTAILLKVIASAMKVFPQFNSSVDMEKSEVIYKKYVNIGVAVDTDRGLLVPVIRDVDKKNISQLSVELTEISKKARDKKLTIEDMQGGCLSISNLGGIGGTYFSPVVNSPEVAILGVSRSAFEPVYIDGEFKPRFMLPLSLSYDHRIIDGADAARFLRWVVSGLENPFLLSLEG